MNNNISGHRIRGYGGHHCVIAPGAGIDPPDDALIVKAADKKHFVAARR
jgi:hypothetical protein